jgi:two-component system, chemotaxis family, protein-glutamate methylesterase/glutaminase
LNNAIVVIGGSAGSLSPLQRIVGDLPADVPATVFVVTHVPPDSVSAMPHILTRSGFLFATHAIDRAPITPGRIIVAPPNRHLAIEDSLMRVVDWPRENGQRPSIDVLFRTAAAAAGENVCGVLLSGTLDDGVAGLQAIRRGGGVAIVQDPTDAMFPDMPRNAVESGAVDIMSPASEIGSVVVGCVGRAPRAREQHGPARNPELDERTVGSPSVFTCPDCGGTLWEVHEGPNLHYRCRTGHAYSLHAMISAQREGLEAALWSAVRIIKERVDLLMRLRKRAEQRGDKLSTNRLDHQIRELREQETMLVKTLSDVVEEPSGTS